MRHAAWLEGLAWASLVGALLWLGGDVVRASYHGYLHTTIGEAVRAEGLRPENPYHAGEALRYYTLYPWLGAWLGSTGLGALHAFAWLNVLAALLLGPALDALGRALGLSWAGRRWAFALTVLAFNACGWLGWWLFPPADASVPVFAFESLTFAAQSWGWDARLQAFLPKYLNVSSFALALVPGLWALAAGWRARRAGTAWPVLLPAGVALAINPLVGGFVGLVLLAWGIPVLLRAATPVRLSWLGAGMGAVLLALPFLLPAFQAAPDGPSLTGKVRFEHDGWTNVLGPLLLLLPFAALGARTLRSEDRLAWAIPVGIAVVAAAMLQLPWGNEYKLVRIAGMLLAIPAGAWLAGSKARRGWGLGMLLLAAPTTVLVARTYLVWAEHGTPPALVEEAGRLAPRDELRQRALPQAVETALRDAPREAMLWMNPVHPGTVQARGLVQGQVLAPVLAHALFVDQPQIHNDRYPDLALRLALTVGTRNLERVFGPLRAEQMLVQLEGRELPGLWEGVSRERCVEAVERALATVPGRTCLVLTASDFPHVVPALEQCGAERLAEEGGISLWRLTAQGGGSPPEDPAAAGS